MIINENETKCYWCGCDPVYIIRDIHSKYDYEFAVCEDHCMTDPEIDAETGAQLEKSVG